MKPTSSESPYKTLNIHYVWILPSHHPVEPWASENRPGGPFLAILGDFAQKWPPGRFRRPMAQQGGEMAKIQT